MKKTLKNLIFLAIIAIVLLMTGSIYAATVNDFSNWGVADVQQSDGVYQIQLTHDLIDGDPKLSQDLIINSGEKVILDLNGYTLQGFTAGCETILVNEGAELTIIDSSNGNGKIIPATGAGAVNLPVIRNNGTLTIKGGVFEQNDAYGIIINWGTLNINGGKFVQSESAKWSILDNKGSATITAGDFDGAASFWMIRNEASLTVNGGDFDSTGNAMMIGSIYEGASLPEENNVITKVTNGTFNSEGGIFVVYDGTELNVSGGDITSVQSNAVYNAGNTTIIGGTIKSENSAAIVLVNNDGATVPAAVNVSGANVTSAEGKDKIEIINNVANENFGTTTDASGNIVAGKVQITVGSTNVNVGDTITTSVTVAGVQVSTGIVVSSTNDNVVKVNDDNTIEAIGVGNVDLTIRLGNVEETVNVSVFESTGENPSGNPTEDPEKNPDEDQVGDVTADGSNLENGVKEESGIVKTGDYIYIAVAVLAIIIVANVVYTVIRKRNIK